MKELYKVKEKLNKKFNFA